MPSTIEVVNKHQLSPEEQKKCIYIGRGSPLGNPYKVKPYGPYDRGATLELYEEHLRGALIRRLPRVVASMQLIEDRVLSGETVRLMCFCKQAGRDVACHGDVIKKIIEERINNQP